MMEAGEVAVSVTKLFIEKPLKIKKIILLYNTTNRPTASIVLIAR
jgi:hypothetical protein